MPSAVTRPELEFFNGLGGFAEGGREYVTILGPGQSTPGAMDERDRQPVVRVPGLGVRVRATRGPGTAARTSSRRGPTTRSPTPGRGDLRPRRRDGELWGPTASRSATRIDLRRPARAGLQPVRAPERRHPLDLLQFVPLGRPGEGLRADHREPIRAGRRLSVTAYAEWVLGTSRGRPRRGSSPPWSRRPARSWRATRGTGVRRPGRLPRSRRAADRLDRRPDGVPRPQRRPRAARRAWTGAPAAAAVGAGLDPCAALQTGFELADGARTQVLVLLGEADGTPRRPRRSSSGAGGAPTTTRDLRCEP
jgi:cyclic beta-1,2-glucan synthetase